VAVDPLLAVINSLFEVPFIVVMVVGDLPLGVVDSLCILVDVPTANVDIPLPLVDMAARTGVNTDGVPVAGIVAGSVPKPTAVGKVGLCVVLRMHANFLASVGVS
jgi:hypothetical protein